MTGRKIGDYNLQLPFFCPSSFCSVNEFERRRAGVESRKMTGRNIKTQ
jgi:hypothetical protein